MLVAATTVKIMSVLRRRIIEVKLVTPQAFAISSPGQRPGKKTSAVNRTLKEFAKESVAKRFGNPFQGWANLFTNHPG